MREIPERAEQQAVNVAMVETHLRNYFALHPMALVPVRYVDEEYLLSLNEETGYFKIRKGRDDIFVKGDRMRAVQISCETLASLNMDPPASDPMESEVPTSDKSKNKDVLLTSATMGRVKLFLINNPRETLYVRYKGIKCPLRIDPQTKDLQFGLTAAPGGTMNWLLAHKREVFLAGESVQRVLDFGTNMDMKKNSPLHYKRPSRFMSDASKALGPHLRVSERVAKVIENPEPLNVFQIPTIRREMDILRNALRVQRGVDWYESGIRYPAIMSNHPAAQSMRRIAHELTKYNFRIEEYTHPNEGPQITLCSDPQVERLIKWLITVTKQSINFNKFRQTLSPNHEMHIRLVTTAAYASKRTLDTINSIFIVTQ